MRTDCMHNLAAEKALLGAGINDYAVARQVAALPEELFTEPHCQATHRAIKRLVSRGVTPDLLTMDAEVQCDFSDTAALMEMQQAGFSPAMASQHEALLREARKRRVLYQLAGNLMQDAPNPGVSVTAIQNKGLETLRRADDAPQSSSMQDVMLALVDSIDSAKSKRRQVGIADFDRLTGGLQAGQLIYIGARPGIGKTALGLAMATHVARHSGPVLFVSLEMGNAEIGARIMAAESGVDLDHLSTGRMQEADYSRITPLYGELAKLPMHVTSRATTPLQVRSEAVRMQTREGLALIAIDYIQLMRGDGRYSSRYEEISAISRELKLMAMELDVPIISMCQLNRQSEKGMGRTKSAPSMAEARDSGALEQDANLFLTLYEPEEPDSQNDEWQLYHMCQANGLAWQVLTVEKNRQGRAGKINVGFDKAHMRYKALIQDQR